jgi:hypothetical protein
MNHDAKSTTIAVIRTDRFNIAMMGRSGSRSFMQDLAGKQDHYEIVTKISSFNREDLLLKQKLNSMKFIPNILVLRDPIERAKSGSFIGLNANYHGYPFLHCIDFDMVTHIIRFEDIGKYVEPHEGKFDSLVTFLPQKEKDKLPKNEEVWKPWDMSEIPEEIMQRELELYEKFLTKPIYNYEDYKIEKQNLQYINFRGVEGIRYKKWDM